MATKQPFTGHFTINNEAKDEEAEAYTEEQAKLFMARKIARAKRVNPGVIINYLKSHPHSYEIKVKG